MNGGAFVTPSETIDFERSSALLEFAFSLGPARRIGCIRPAFATGTAASGLGIEYAVKTINLCPLHDC